MFTSYFYLFFSHCYVYNHAYIYIATNGTDLDQDGDDAIFLTSTQESTERPSDADLSELLPDGNQDLSTGVPQMDLPLTDCECEATLRRTTDETFTRRESHICELGFPDVPFDDIQYPVSTDREADTVPEVSSLSDDHSQTYLLKPCINDASLTNHPLSFSSSETLLKRLSSDYGELPGTGDGLSQTSLLKPCINDASLINYPLTISSSDTFLKRHTTDTQTETYLKRPFSGPSCEGIDSQTVLKRRKRKCRRFKRRHQYGKYKHDEKSVVNLSSIDLSTEQKIVLGLGPKFCPTPKTINKPTLLCDVAEGCRKVRLKEFFHGKETETEAPRFYKPTGWTPPLGRDVAVDAYCASVINNTTHHAHTGRVLNNLDQPLRIALIQLRQLVIDRVIRISRADKGGAVVVQSVDSYVCEAHRQLGNDMHYTILTSDPTVKVAKKSNAIVNKLCESDHISEKTKEWATLNPNLVRPQQFYHLPKIHKTLVNPPGRPIVSGSGGPTEHLSKLVASWLQDIVCKLPSYIKDSTHVLNIIEDWNRRLGPFPEGTRLVAIDVVGLYTNIPHEDIEVSVTHFLSEFPQLNIPPANVIVDVMNHILKNNTFVFEGKIYKQIHGTAMGTPMAPAIANLFMGWLEKRLIEGSPFPIDIDLWRRFLDDILMLWMGTEDDLKTFMDYCNTFHPTIKFTYSSSTLKLPHMDVLLKIEDGFISTDLYTKPTDAHAYLHRQSCHPLHCVMNIPYSQMLRLRRLCSSEEVFEKRICDMTKQFKARGYSHACIAKAADRARRQQRAAALEYQPKTNTTRVPFVITHNPMNPPLRHILREEHVTLHKSEVMKAAMPEPPIVGERNCRSIRDILMPSILPRHTTSTVGTHKCSKGCVLCREHFVECTSFASDQTGETFNIRDSMNCKSDGVIYLLSCVKCKYNQYVGETKQTLTARVAGHRSDINTRSVRKCPHVVTHFNAPGHSLQDMRIFPIEQMRSSDSNSRKMREKFWMSKLRTVYPHGLNELS